MSREPRKRGIEAVHKAREARAAGKSRWPSVRFWGWSAMILLASAIGYWKWAQDKVERQRSALLAEQRGAQKALEERWGPLRDRVETWTQELAALPSEGFPEVVDEKALAAWDFRQKPGIYLRLRQDEAKSAESIRAGAMGSLRDAFTSCLLRAANADPLAGKECKRTRDCAAGELCNENDRCARPAQPYNLRVAYRALRVFRPEWTKDVQEAATQLRLQALSEAFKDAKEDDLPVMADLLARAQYFLVVLDEMPEGKTVAAGDGGTLTEAVQLVPHPARVAVYRLSDGKLVLRVRREAGGELLGGNPAADPEVLEARQRQANSCALALAVREAIGDPAGAAVPPKE